MQIHQLVADQFSPNASAYVTSPTHSDEKSLLALVELVQPAPADRLLDVATGAGHTGLAFAPKLAHVELYDLTQSMLDEAARLAKAKGIDNFSIRQGAAEEMPFEDDSFDIVTVRTAPHHFADIERFLKETYRVLKPGGKFLMVDTTVPEEEQIAEEINRIEKLRDPSHGRNLSPSQWTQKVVAQGFTIVSQQLGMHAGGKKMALHQWMDRIGTPAENREEILGAFMDPTPELVESLEIARKGDEVWFSLPELTLLAIK